MGVESVDVAAARMLAAQSGVIARRQVLGAGGAAHDIERRLRRREWSRLLPGVFVDHTGEPTWTQRAWAGVLYYSPAALAAESAIRAVRGPEWQDPRGPRASVLVAVACSRNVRPRAGFGVRWVSGIESMVQPNAGLPRVRFEDAVLQAASRTLGEWQVIETLADACRSRHTTSERLRLALDRHPRLPRRSWIASVLEDLAEGTCSVLEHGYLTRVERAHGLPRPGRQRPDTLDGGRIYRDVDYERFGLIVELDGRLHDALMVRDADLDRDLEAASDGRRTVRLGWGQVFDRPCRTAARLARLLSRGGWTGRPRRCGPDCPL